MDVLVYLIPVSLALGAVGLLAFFWALRSRQFKEPLDQTIAYIEGIQAG